ncbi:hypothetical protein A176_007429 [Myxococcus hansupus]|uniref:Uncharacterized protein n=1 Tax=Pseudomyxococcus hansupus TaxID=1297742 RepID=A0A0H4XQ83_9BACT|nr:hypothetical protein A176_007429 [Myxococcus hansupus]
MHVKRARRARRAVGRPLACSAAHGVPRTTRGRPAGPCRRHRRW